MPPEALGSCRYQRRVGRDAARFKNITMKTVATTVRISTLIKILVSQLRKGHLFVDIEIENSTENPNSLTVFPALAPLEIKTLEETEAPGPLDPALISQLI